MGTTQIRVVIIIPIAIPGQPKASALKPVMEPSEPWTIDWSRKPDASTDDQRTPKPMLSIPTCEPMSAEAEPIMVAEPEPMMFASRKAMLSHCECRSTKSPAAELTTAHPRPAESMGAHSRTAGCELRTSSPHHRRDWDSERHRVQQVFDSR